MSEPNRSAAERYFAAFERWDLETVESLLADGIVEGRPQSGERFVGPANVIGMLRNLPSRPSILWQRIRGGPSMWVAEGIVDYGDGPVRLIGIVELDDGKVVVADYYFSDPFDAPEYRARWTEQPRG